MTFIGYNFTNKQTNKHQDKQSIYIDVNTNTLLILINDNFIKQNLGSNVKFGSCSPSNLLMKI